MKEFIKWFMETQLIKSKIPIWRDFFMNATTIMLVHVFSYQVISGTKVSSEFMILFSMVLGYYFNHKADKDEKHKD